MSRLTHIGLLMVRNEADVLAEALAEHARRFPMIVAMDGSTDGGRDLIAACPQVIQLFRDEDLLRPGERWTDGHRNAALEWILREFGCDGIWITLLHADEFWHDDPIAHAERCEAEGATIGTWGEFRFFLHTTDRDTLDLDAPVTRRVTWWGGPFFEDRQFRLANHQAYEPGKDHCTVPLGTGASRRLFGHIPRYRHYPYRSVAQCRHCFRDKCESRYWQPDHGWLAGRPGDPFRTGLPMPANSPLAAWANTGRMDPDAPDLPDATEFLPAHLRC